MSYEDEMEEEVLDSLHRLAWTARRRRAVIDPDRYWVHHDAGPRDLDAQYADSANRGARSMEGDFPDGRRFRFPDAIEVRSRISP